MLKYNHIKFPSPKKASKEGLVAIGGDLSFDLLISAYVQGIFPWFGEGEPIIWWSPDPRLILIPAELKVSKSLLQRLRTTGFEHSFDRHFDLVISHCAKIKRKGQSATWITPEMIDAYCKLHEMGIAHSVEVYYQNKLAGGLYGLAIGKVFFGESMFHLKTDASKIALVHLCRLLIKKDFFLIDAQQSTKHLKSLGAKEISRNSFIEKIKIGVYSPVVYEKWC